MGIEVGEYLATSYSPDKEYVDGVLMERNVGEYLHSLVQTNVVFALRNKYPNVRVLPGLRSRVSETRFRLPDVCVIVAAPPTPYLTEPPFLAIEILAAEERISEVLAKLAEYETIGVAHIWVIDPILNRIFVYRSGDLIKCARKRWRPREVRYWN